MSGSDGHRGARARDVVAFAFLWLGCGAGDAGSTESGPTCPHDDTTIVELTAVSPAPGASVQNSGIVHTFTTVGLDAYFDRLRVAPLSSHTAGNLPAELSYTVTASGDDYVYALMPLAWPTAPARVSLYDRGVYLHPDDGCRLALPSPLFDYELIP